MARRGWRLVLFFSPWRIARTLRFVSDVRHQAKKRNTGGEVTVAIDINAFWEPLTGIGWYLYLVLEELAERDDLKLRLYGPQMIVDEHAPQPTVALPEGRAIEVVQYHVPDELCLPRSLFIRVLRKCERFLVAANRNQVVFAPTTFRPRGSSRLAEGSSRRFTTWGSRRCRDSPRRDQGTARAQPRCLHASGFDHPDGLRNSPPGTARFRLPGTRLGAHRPPRPRSSPPGLRASRATRPAVSGLWAPRGYSRATQEPGQPARCLEVARREHGLELELVLCGHSGWKSERLLERIDAATASGWLHHFGYVDEGLLASLYENASFLPAPRCTKVLACPCSRRGASVFRSSAATFQSSGRSPETAAVFCNPERPEDWARVLARVASSPEERSAMSRASKRRFAEFSWAKTAGETAERLAAGRQRRPSRLRWVRRWKRQAS